VENRFYVEAVRPRILPLAASPLGHAAEQRDVDVVIAQNIVQVDQAGLKNAISVASAATATAAAIAPASGTNEIEFLIKQFDRVSKMGNILHVGLLSVLMLMAAYLL
jgi:hypothetical protein